MLNIIILGINEFSNLLFYKEAEKKTLKHIIIIFIKMPNYSYLLVSLKRNVLVVEYYARLISDYSEKSSVPAQIWI